MKTLTHGVSLHTIRKPLLLGFGCPEGFGSAGAFQKLW